MIMIAKRIVLTQNCRERFGL